MNSDTYGPTVLVPSTYLYRAYGMTLSLDRPVPRLSPASLSSQDEPVTIEFGTVPVQLDGAESADEFFQATASAYRYHQPGQWTILVKDGRWALFEAMRPLGEEFYWYTAVTNSAAIAGYQRGMFPLHGSGVLFPSGMVAFTGQSGAGKTTLTAGLVQRGFPLFADDLCLIRSGPSGYRTGRGAPEIRLLRDAAEALGWDQGESIGHQRARDKFAFVREKAPVDDAPMRAIVELAFDDGPARLERLSGIDSFTALVGAIRLRMGLPAFPASQRADAFELVTRLTRQIPVYRFTRPRSYSAFAQGLDILTEHLGKE